VKRIVAVVFVATLVVVIASGAVAGAKPNSPRTARATATAFVASLLPSAPTQPGICDTKTDSGFFARRASYLASCASSDGAFQFFSIVAARNGPVNTNSPYLESRLTAFCAAGHAYRTGVKGKFVNTYAGALGVADVASGLAAMGGSDLQKTKGYIAPFKLC